MRMSNVMSDQAIETYILNNEKHIVRQLKRALKKKVEAEKLQALADLASFCTTNTCNRMVFPELENALLQVAQRHTIEQENSYKPHTFLHVLTTPYLTGGHTRVLERWIKNAPPHSQHSVLITDLKDPLNLPPLLEKLVTDHGGSLTILPPASPFIEKALALRKKASAYEAVILHVHMNDMVPLLAFGTTDFLRPVVFFNHVDHLFWLGASISDLVVNLRTFSTEFNQWHRGIRKQCLLPLPLEQPDPLMKHTDQNTALKKRLGIPLEAKVVLTMASSYKYKPFAPYDFMTTLQSILNRVPEAVLLAIGPSETDEHWQNAVALSSGRIFCLGEIPHDELEPYLGLADLAMDSFPMSSFTALLDIAKYNIPCLTLKTPLNELDTFQEAGIFCDTPEVLIEKAVLALNTPTVSQTLYDILERDHLPDGFSKHLVACHQQFPSNHCLQRIKIQRKRKPTALEIFVCKMQTPQDQIRSSRQSALLRCVISILPSKTLRQRCKAFFNIP